MTHNSINKQQNAQAGFCQNHNNHRLSLGPNNTANTASKVQNSIRLHPQVLHTGEIV